jgi:ribonuclease HI
MKIIKIYSDGSHLKRTTGRLGCGGVMVDVSGGGFGKILDSYSTELTQDKLRADCGSVDVSNPTAEMFGVLECLRNFNIPDTADKIIFMADYEGVSKWLPRDPKIKTWKIKAAYIQKLYDLIWELIEEKGIADKVEFAWVKGHQSKQMSVLNPDAYYNDLCDSLAKGESI